MEQDNPNHQLSEEEEGILARLRKVQKSYGYESVVADGKLQFIKNGKVILEKPISFLRQLLNGVLREEDI